jgi:NAD(P)-dependent dehydrogenase (short-subunit alcohol dehydrogenase family)
MTMQKQRRERNRTGLGGRVAVVTGASCGAGRAFAAVLGERGATVYITGRSVRSQPTTDGLPGTNEDTADEVNRRAGKGIAVRCDHSDEREVETLFQRVRPEQGRLDILPEAWTWPQLSLISTRT